MPPLSKAHILGASADRLRDAAKHLKDGQSPRVWLGSIRAQLVTLENVRRWAQFTSENSYTNFPGVRTHLKNVAITIDDKLQELAEILVLLEANPTDVPTVMRLAMLSIAIRSIKLAPKPRSDALDEADTLDGAQAQETLVDE